MVDLIISFISTFKRLVISQSIKQFGTNCRFVQMGRIVAFSKRDELTLGTNCRFLEFGTNCRLRRIVAQAIKHTLAAKNTKTIEYRNHRMAQRKFLHKETCQNKVVTSFCLSASVRKF